MARDMPGRLLRHLPAIYREGGGDGELALLLRPFEELLFVQTGEASERLPGIEAALGALPALFAPLGTADGQPQPVQRGVAGDEVGPDRRDVVDRPQPEALPPGAGL